MFCISSIIFTPSINSMKAKYRWMILAVCFICALVGFMMKIPRPLRGNDKFLHTAFYFCAAAFLDLLFPRRLPIILVGLLLFGVAIEYLQEWSNGFFHMRIHGRYDKQDIYANAKGLVYYLPLGVVVWVVRRSRRM